MVRCEDGSLYTGITTDPHRRMREHVLQLAAGAKYTKSHPVVSLDALWSAETRSAAASLEAAIKRLPAEKKRKLTGAPSLLGAFCRVDASLYRPEPLFCLDALRKKLS